MGRYIFNYCKNLNSVTIEGNDTEIGEHAFKACDNLYMFVNKGSKAEAYAKENDIICIAE